MDFVCLEASLVVELDGGQHAIEVEKDGRRTERLRREGFKVLWFWNNEVHENLEGVLEVILAALRAASPSPRPSPRGEREKLVGSATDSDSLSPRGEG